MKLKKRRLMWWSVGTPARRSFCLFRHRQQVWYMIKYMKTQSQTAVTLFLIGYKCHFCLNGLACATRKIDQTLKQSQHVLAAGSTLGCVSLLMSTCPRLLLLCVRVWRHHISKSEYSNHHNMISLSYWVISVVAWAIWHGKPPIVERS